MHPDLIMAIICDRMGFTYQQYMSQPAWFIKLLLLKFSQDASYQNKQLE